MPTPAVGTGSRRVWLFYFSGTGGRSSRYVFRNRHNQIATENNTDKHYRRSLSRLSTNLPTHPVTIEEWAAADDNNLCYASSGFVLYDPSNALSERISAFQKAYYPADIWKWKIASDLWGIWHNGDYNSSYRLAKRGDGIGLLIGQGAFVESTLRLLCLLNKRFPVYWKWLHWQAQSLPKWIDMIEPSLKKLESANNHETRGRDHPHHLSINSGNPLQNGFTSRYRMAQFHGQRRDCPANRIDCR